MTICKDRTVYYAYNVGGMHFKVSVFHEPAADRYEFECMNKKDGAGLLASEVKNGQAAIRAVKEWINGKEETLGSEISDRVFRTKQD
jgi:hypothetical protein